MKKNLHPVWLHDAVVTCSCGNTFLTGATQATLNVDICSKCHPFFTGEMRFVDRQGRVDKFRQKLANAAQQQQLQAQRQAQKAQKQTAQKNAPQSYRQALQQQQQVLKKAAKPA